VAANGTLARGSGVDSVTRTAAGRYRVDFEQAVDACVFIATVGQTGTTTPAGLDGLATTGGDATGTDRVMAYTWATNLAATDKSFHLAVLC